MKIALYLLLAVTSAQAFAQGTAAAAASTSGGSGVEELMVMVQAVAQKSNADVARLRIEKWKTDVRSQQQSGENAAAIRRNLVNAVPDLLLRVRSEPSSLIANFRLYRDLNVLYDALSGLVESAGAFGPQEQYAPVAADLAQLDQLRRQMAERVDLLAGNTDAELARLRAEVRKGTKPPSRIVVDDNQPSPKKKPKKSSSPAHPSPQE